MLYCSKMHKYYYKRPVFVNPFPSSVFVKARRRALFAVTGIRKDVRKDVRKDIRKAIRKGVRKGVRYIQWTSYFNIMNYLSPPRFAILDLLECLEFFEKVF